jgi:hypothetical protein
MLPEGDSLARRWRRLKKHCSFSSGDKKLVRSKSFIEQETLANSSNEDRDKYHTVATRDATKFQGIRDKIAQWNSDLKKRRSSENLASHYFQSSLSAEKESDETSQFVTALPQQGQVKNAVVVNYGTIAKGGNRDGSLPPWSPSPSPPISDISSDSNPDHRRSDYFGNQSSALFQDQDSGYDGFCPEQSIYSTTSSSDSSSVISSEAEQQSLAVFPSLYGRAALARPRPAPIYEKDGGRDYTYRTLSPRIAQATVVNLVRGGEDASLPPPLPPRPSHQPTPPISLPPPTIPKPESRTIRQGAVSLPRRRTEFQERFRSKGTTKGESLQEDSNGKRSELNDKVTDKVDN